MTLIYRCEITKVNCFLCSHYHPSPTVLYQGSCTANAPQGSGAVPDGTSEGFLFPWIARPSDTTCGDFKPWERIATNPRTVGNCYEV